ncbi:helix-turn-helix domain-containing protein [Neorhizobium alkalisoli]|uniref:helix-turn-helix domain-containing protein n=1 Tax=Neorhizobium alkalisoli TaxID=528178 RepID=UPI00197BBADE|nr:AraC family transcriptional regulator [Neorhizobium alkalisoli]
MSYWHSMIWRTEGIRVVAPVKWRQLDGLVSVLWEAESQSGATGYYLSDDPRIMIFFDDVSSRIRISNQDGEFSQHYRPMTRAIYVPAGIPMWTSSKSIHRFSHLNLHMHRDRMLRFLSPSIGASAAVTALRRPVEIQDIGAIETLAALLVDEIASPSKHAIYAESLVGSIVAGLLDIPENEGKTANGRLTQAQMNKLISRLNARSDCRLTIAEMAATVGLSESWFATVFKQTTGKTPLQWQLSKRIDLAKKLLSESDLSIAGIAVQLGFSDQAHLTKAFGQIAGDTPAAWRRMQQIRQF